MTCGKKLGGRPLWTYPQPGTRLAGNPPDVADVERRRREKRCAKSAAAKMKRRRGRK